ncbi:MAG TPA: thiolase family protein [Dehalococcoidia bacterium]|nr:thiolase family protein [Dehalococcoidia bacterium]
MPGKVAIVGVEQTTHAERLDKSVRELVYEVTRGLLDKLGLRADEVQTVITSSSDYWQGISCSNAYYFEAAASNRKDASKAEEDSALGFIYACMRVLSGHFHTALVVGVTKGSEIPSLSTLTNLSGDPFYQRPLGVDDISAAALQAQLYMQRYGITEEQMAQVAVKNLGNALRNPFAHRKGKLTVDEVLQSRVLAYPLRELECCLASDGACALLVASEERARGLAARPAWVQGMGWGTAHYYLGDRDLLGGALRPAAERAYRMAGISSPSQQIDVAELCEPFSYQELLWCEQLGLCPEGEGGRFLESGATAMGGRLPINPSGGVLSANPYVARGLIRIAEAASQVMGQAGEHQVPGAKTALAHNMHGWAGQLHSVVILGS